MDEIKAQVTWAMSELDLDVLCLSVQALVAKGCDSTEIVELLQQGLLEVGNRFAQGEYFLADLIVSGMMFKSALSLITPEAPPVGAAGAAGSAEVAEAANTRGRVLIGVMAGDIHDIGKDIIVQVLRTESFDVLDLGVDVPVEAFVQAALNYTPDIIALSGVMGGAALEMKLVVEALTEAGIHPATPILVGGSCVSELILENIGDVNYAKGPVEAVKFCVSVMESK
ncbi:MAG: cobalamin-dependent protein [Coriobacteriales bacterium]|jgi:methanogenic corrinoid protein MtbC1|nr:cobalamin-dependent protein [Coriobacteriales bacterium]